MKKSTVLLFIMTFALLVISGCNEKKSEPTSTTNDTTPYIPVKDLPVESLALSPKSYHFPELGETLQLEVAVLPKRYPDPKVTWKSSNTAVAKVSEDGLVTSAGKGTAVIIATAGGVIETCEVTVDAEVKDICGNTYEYVMIGEQFWMAENMRCNKYDTKSGRYGAEITMYSYKSHKDRTFEPYCVDASEKSNWENQTYVVEDLLLHIDELGYLYNWAAAVGLISGNAAKIQTLPLNNCQGICPNGWHVPTAEEWSTLDRYPGFSSGTVLKAKYGWYNDGNGDDKYSFAALPAGGASGSKVSFVGMWGNFWTASPQSKTTDVPSPNSRDNADKYIMYYNSDNVMSGFISKDYAYSVRCVRN